jgi:hypothetical protein
MIRNVVVHIANEQPLMADLFDMPSPADVALVCANLRSMNGTRPVFIDDMASYFIFPLTFIRFVEIPQSSLIEAGIDEDWTPTRAAAVAPDVRPAQPRPAGPPAVRRPAPGTAPTGPEPELEIDEDFLKRVRDI